MDKSLAQRLVDSKSERFRFVYVKRNGIKCFSQPLDSSKLLALADEAFDDPELYAIEYEAIPCALWKIL